MSVRVTRFGLAVVVAALLGGCGGDDSGGDQSASGTTSTTVAAEPDTAPTADGTETQAAQLLDDWADRIVPVLILARERRAAQENGDAAGAARLERQFARKLRPVEKWGRDARKAFIDADDSEVAGVAVATGDAWAQWAYTLRTDPPAGDFSKAQDIADLAVSAIREHRRAYQLAGRPIPDALRTG